MNLSSQMCLSCQVVWRMARRQMKRWRMLKKPCSCGLIRLGNSEIPFLSQKGVAFSMHDAPTAKADYFCTCDDKLYYKATAIPGLTCKVITLFGLIPEVTK